MLISARKNRGKKVKMVKNRGKISYWERGTREGGGYFFRKIYTPVGKLRT